MPILDFNFRIITIRNSQTNAERQHDPFGKNVR